MILVHVYIQFIQSLLLLQDDWAIAYTHATMSGSKVYYKCKHAARCPAEMHLAYSADCDQVSLNLTSKEHDHVQGGTSHETHRGIHPQTREVINSLFIDGVRKPKAIFAALRNRKCSQLPSKIQMANYLVSLRNKHLGKRTISLGELSAWAEARKMVPDDDDQAFVCGFECSYGQRKKESAFFRVSISTKRLLKLGSRSANIHADATYKLIWQGYPVLITGYSDANRQFHPISLAITMDEAKEDFHFIFAAVANGVSMIYPDDHPGFAPTHLICDAAPAIKNGYTSAFGHEPEKTISCWAHVVMNMDKQIVRVRDKETRVAIREDIFLLQLCPDEDSFHHAAALFLTKWESSDKDGVASFLEYFQGSWLQRNYTWFEGYAPGFPSTNNGLEALNMIIKRQHTFRERHDLGRFLSIVEQDIVLTWSRDRDDSQAGHTEVASQPMRTLACWTSAYQWAVSEAESLKSGQNVYVSSDSLTNTDLKTSVILQKECFQRAGSPPGKRIIFKRT